MKKDRIRIIGKKEVLTEDIVLIKAASNYTEIFLESGQKIVVSKTLKDMENRLNSNNFLRTHKSFLVNVYHIASNQLRVSNFLNMGNNLKAEVSRRKRSEVNNYLETILA